MRHDNAVSSSATIVPLACSPIPQEVKFGREYSRRAARAGRYCGPPRIEAGWPGSLMRPMSISRVPLTFNTDMSLSMKLPT